MNVCRNKKSGKFFVCINEIDWGRIKVVTPLNQIKVLESRLFEYEVEGTETEFLRNGIISAQQLKAYKDYRTFQLNEKPEISPKKQTPAIKQSINESSYLKGSRAMKTIEIDDDVYVFLQSKAIPFEEPTPNHVIRRLIGLGKRRQTSNNARDLKIDNTQRNSATKTASPPANEWANTIPELSGYNFLNWKQVCDHLSIHVGKDSGRRVLKQWVAQNKPNWNHVPGLDTDSNQL